MAPTMPENTSRPRQSRLTAMGRYVNLHIGVDSTHSHFLKSKFAADVIQLNRGKV